MIAALDLGATTSGADFPDISQLPARPELPDLFMMLDGRCITTAEQWNRQSRPELKALSQYYMYDFMPPAPESIRAEVDLLQGHLACWGNSDRPRPRSSDNCTPWATSGSGRGTCWTPTPSAPKKRRIRRAIRRLPPRWVKRFADETDRLRFPPRRAAWGLRGRPLEVPISGANARRVVFGTIDIDTGHRLFLVRERQRGEDFRAFLPMIRSHYRGWPIALLWDEDPSHPAEDSRDLAAALGIRPIWLPKRSPELNGMDHLWAQGKAHVCANRRYTGIEEEVDRLVGSLGGLSNREALRQAGILSEDFWLKV